MWSHLRARFWSVYVRVLHPGIPADESVEALRGLPEGSKLLPMLFGLVVADLVRALQREFPTAIISHGPSSIWVGCILYVDDLALISTDPNELQAMIDFCQEWGERSRMQINAQKSKVVAFHEDRATQLARRAPRKVRRRGGHGEKWVAAGTSPPTTGRYLQCDALSMILQSRHALSPEVGAYLVHVCPRAAYICCIPR